MAKQDIFHEKAGRFVTHDTAKKYQDKYLKKKSDTGDKDPVRSQFFGIEHIKKLISRPGCTGIKIYYGADDNDAPGLVLVAADKAGKNHERNLSGLKDPDDGDYVADGPICPVHCENTN